MNIAENLGIVYACSERQLRYCLPEQDRRSE